MSEINYHETIVVPNLYKRLHSLIGENITLDLNLQIEQAKYKNLVIERDSQISSLLEETSNLKQQIKNIQDVMNEKEKIKIELSQVKSNNDELNRDLNNEKGKYTILTKDYLALKNQYDLLHNEIQELKKPKEKKKNKKEELVTVE